MAALRWILLTFGTILGVYAQDPESQFFSKQERPEWVQTAELPTKTNEGKSEGGSVNYLLSDIQHHLEENSWYSHLAIDILSEAGVENYSQLNLDFQPEYEKIILHELTIIRNGEKIDRLPDIEFKIIQREEDLESQLYDGEQTVHLILKDIRPGDTLSYAFSRQGSNPVFQNHFHQFTRLSYSIDFDLVRRRVIWNPEQRDLQWQKIGETADPIETQNGTLSELKWEQANLEKLTLEKNVPSWMLQHHWIEYSDYRDWKEFGVWFADIYQTTEELPEDIIAVCEQLRADSATDSELIVNTLRWVQRNVRYLGSFMGEHTHEPYSLAEIIERRFGDCKDQGKLTTTMLNHLGFDAAPALVNTSARKSVKDYLPGHASFDHLIVHLRWQGEDYWLDPTYTFQGGPLETLHIGEYAYAYTVREDEPELIPLKTRGFEVDQTTILENFDILDDGEATLKVVTTATGGDANRLRRNFATDPLEEFQESYLKFYQSLHPEAELLSPLTYKDDLDSNTITITEHYKIADIWILDEGDNPTNRRTVTFATHLIDEKVGLPKDEKRQSPYYISYPNRLTHIIDVALPSQWNIDPFKDTIDHPSFQFDSECEIKDKSLTLSYHYQSKASSVSAKDYQSYRKNIEEMLNNLDYYISDADPSEAEDESEGDNSNILGYTLWGSGVALGIFVSLFTIILLFFFWNPAPRPPSTTMHQGLGGWLVLPIIGILISPFTALYLISSYFTPLAEMNSVLEAETDFYGWRLYYFSGALIETTYLFLSILLIIFLFTKRTSFPYLYITIAIFTLITELYMISIESNLEILEDGVDRSTLLGQTIFRSILWGSYMLVSQRVKATFTKRHGHKYPPPLPAKL